MRSGFVDAQKNVDTIVSGAGVRVNLVLSVIVPEHIKDTFYGANLCAWNKDGWGIRPIAVKNTLRRLATTVGQKPMAHGLGNHFSPTQLGQKTKRDCKAAVSAARLYVNAATHRWVILK